MGCELANELHRDREEVTEWVKSRSYTLREQADEPFRGTDVCQPMRRPVNDL